LHTSAKQKRTYQHRIMQNYTVWNYFATKGESSRSWLTMPGILSMV
jgi:hypothetical protein